MIGKFFEGNGPNNLYLQAVSEIQANGQLVVSRKMETKELHPVMMVLWKPQERFLTCPGRKIHPYFQAMEAIYILGGRGDVDWISYYLKNIKQFSDDRPEFNAPYGTRMRYYNHHRSIGLGEKEIGVSTYSGTIQHVDQFRNSFEYLKKDSDTRHALMSFWNPNFDNVDRETIDRPCNVIQHFLVRDGKLDLSIFCRSNDVHLGLFNANVVQFSVILEAMAMLLEIPVGTQTHFINSLHYYLDSPITERIFDEKKKPFNVYDHVDPRPFEMATMKGQSRINTFDSELDRFFKVEATIRDGNIPEAGRFNFSFLNDALALAKSFYYYKQKNYFLAADYLLDLQADDLFVSTLEFVARKASDEELAFIVDWAKDRFSSLDEKSLIEIENYIRLH